MPNDKIKLTGPSMEQRVADRLRNSGFGANPNQTTVHGTGPTRTHTNIFHGGHVRDHGSEDKEGNKR
jgi:hypothetical protein